MKLAIGNSDVPVGQYTQKIFAYYEIDEAAIAELRQAALDYQKEAMAYKAEQEQ